MVDKYTPRPFPNVPIGGKLYYAEGDECGYWVYEYVIIEKGPFGQCRVVAIDRGFDNERTQTMIATQAWGSSKEEALRQEAQWDFDYYTEHVNAAKRVLDALDEGKSADEITESEGE